MSLTETELLHTPSETLLVAIRDLLGAKGMVSTAEIAERIAITDAANPAIGAAIIARAWTDPDYRARLLANGSAAAEEMGASMRGAPPLGVLENTEGVHHLVVCTLCSCYPRAVLGYPPFWFKSAGYRAPRGAGSARRAPGMGHEAARCRVHPCRRFDRRLPLDGAAAPSSRHRRVGRGPARHDPARGRHAGRHRAVTLSLCRRPASSAHIAGDEPALA